MAPKNKKKAQSLSQRRQARLIQEQIRKARTEVEPDDDEDLDDIEELEGEDVPDEEDVVEEVDPAAESLKKQLEAIEKDGYGMGEMAMSMPMTGPTSFDELDAAEAAKEQAGEIQETSWNVQSLVYNILSHPIMDAKEKADAIQKVGTDFGERVSEILASPEPVEKDLDALSLEAILAHDKRETGFNPVEIVKALLSTAARKKLSASDFALPSKRKYPIHDKAHVLNALARAAQQIKAGGAGAADARAALPKIRAAAKRMGIGAKMSKERNAMVIEKDSAGNWRWVGWVSNNFEDRSGDIITEAAHREYVDWVNKDLAERAPVFTSCHAPGTVREHPVDFVAYENGFLVMSGKLNEAEAEQLMTVSKDYDIGMSHTSWGLRDAKNSQMIVKYRSFEVTDLPVATADNPFTTVDVLSKEEGMNDQLEYLSKLLGSKEKAEKALKLKTGLAQKELEEAGVESKEVKTVEQPVPAPVPATDPAMDAILERISKELDIPGLNDFVLLAKDAIEKVPVLEKAIKELSAGEDERLAEKIAPKPGFAWSKRPSESADTVVKEEDPLKKAAPTPGKNWLSEITGTEPVKAQ